MEVGLETLEWKPEYSIGIAAVDHEHKELIEAVNGALKLMSPGVDQSKSKIDAVRTQLGAIHSMVAAHFALEEKEMRDLHYPDYARHKDDHETLLDTFVDILAEIEVRSLEDLAAELRPRLSNWFSRHFREEDSKLHKFLVDRN